MEYNAKSIQQLTFIQAVRSRIGIYLGSADHTGVIAGFLELVNNATDEALVCDTATKIELEIGPDWASCRDYGRGMPHGPNDFSKEVMINLLTENHSGAKFDDNAYGGKSRGLNGTGSAATCCSSDWFKISSFRDGAEWYMEFEKGIPKWEVCQKKPLNGQANGTYIIYKPSQEVFRSEPIHLDYNEICEQMKEYSYFNKGIKFIVKNSETQEIREFLSKNGLIDFVTDKIGKGIHKTPLIYKTSENGIDLEMILQWTANREEKFYLFSNGGENENGGTPITGIRTALTNFFKKRVKADASPDIMRKGLTYVCSINLKDPIYDGQTKSKITNPELRGLCQRATTQMLEQFEREHKDEFNKITELLTREVKAELAAEKARKQVLEAVKEIEKGSKAKILNPDKLRDARQLGENSTLLICEGLSAGGSMSIGRDPNKYGILMLRGKAKNLLSCPIEEGLNNEEIKLFIQAMGITYGQKYNSKKLRYGKVAIASDADFDGSHIGLLVLAMIQVLCPELIEENRVYWLRAPIYKVETKSKDYFFYTEEEYLTKGKISGNIIKYKGLGQLSEQDLRNSMFNSENQYLEQIEFSERGVSQLISLMGDDSEPKKDFVFNNIDFKELAFE